MNHFSPLPVQKPQLHRFVYIWLTLFLGMAIWLLSASHTQAQAPYKGSELFVYNMEGQPPFTNKYPACMKFVSFEVPSLYCPPPPDPAPDPGGNPPAGGGGGDGMCDVDGGIAFLEPNGLFMPPPPGGQTDAFGNSLIGMSFFNTNANCSWTSNAARLTVCPVAGSGTVITGFYFEYGTSNTGGGRAIVSPTLQVLVNGVQVYTQTFTSSDQYNGFFASFPPSLNTTSWEGKNVTFVVTDVRGRSIDDFAIIGFNNCSNNKVCVGDLVWEDTNGNGIRDAGEAVKANVKVQIFRDDNDGAFELPSKDYLFEDGKDGLIAETTTDANGIYKVCVPAGNYFVRISPDNFDAGKPLAGCFPTLGPSVSGNSDENNKDHANAALKPAYKNLGIVSTLVTLAPGTEPTNDGDDANTNSTIDFGVMCNPNMLMNLGNLVWKDLNKNGLKDPTEVGFDGIKLELFVDVNANNVYDAADVKAGETTTDASGIYSFAGLLPANYLLVMPSSNFQTFFGPAWGWQISPVQVQDPNTNTDNDNNGLVGTLEPIVTRAINLAFGQEPTNDGDGNNGNLTLDIGLYQDEPCVEYLIPEGVSNNQHNAPENRKFTLVDKNGNVLARTNNTPPISGGYRTMIFDWLNNRFIETIYNPNPILTQHLFTRSGSTLTNTTSYISATNAGDAFGSPGNYSFGADGNIYMSSGSDMYRLIVNPNQSLTVQYAGSHPGTFFQTIDKNMNVYGQISNKIRRRAYNFGSLEWTTLGGVDANFPAGYTYYSNNSTNSAENTMAYIPKVSRVYMLAINRTSQKLSIVSIPENFTTTTASRVDIDITGLPDYVSSIYDNGSWGIIEQKESNFFYHHLLYDPYTHRVILHARKYGSWSSGSNTNDQFSRMFVFDIGANGQLTYSFNAPTSYNGPGIYIMPCGGGGGGGTPPPLENTLKLGNRVWNDVNNNGLLDSGEQGIANVGMVLYKDNGDGVFDRLTDTRWDSTTTDANGFYLFDKLPNGDYFVWVSSQNFGIGKALNGRFSSTTTQANPNTDIDNDDNGINPETPRSHANDGVTSGKVTLALGTEPPSTVDGDDTNGNMTVDFGFYTPNPTRDNILKIGNRVWNDANNNIRIDAGETFFNGVKLTLFRDNGDLLFNASQDQVVGTTTTA
ncbi:MAG: SdrD B-like domain-containing protein, partial [Runella sp.]